MMQTSVQGIDIKLSVNSPSPGQKITVTAESYLTSLGSANIVWTLNGSVYQKGVGATSIQVVAPELGKKLTIGVSATDANGRIFETSTTISSGNVDLILETGGYVPPFFRGKIPLSYQNHYSVVAFPHIANSSGTEYDPKTLVYKWTKDTKVMQDASGYGKQVFSWKEESIPRSRIINVKVTTRDGSIQAEKTIILGAANPFVRFYSDDPLYGPLYNKVLGSRIGFGASNELAIISVPFGFNKPSDGVGSLSFAWLINSAYQEALSASQSIVLRTPAGQSGSSDISLEISNGSDILQGAKGGFSVVFSSKNTTLQEDNASNFNGI
jgi:hypothetical protein